MKEAEGGTGDQSKADPEPRGDSAAPATPHTFWVDSGSDPEKYKESDPPAEVTRCPTRVGAAPAQPVWVFHGL